jgi:dephospho-CoA kinase
MNDFLKKNKNKKIIVLDIPLLLENKINKKTDILIFVKSNKSEILRRLKKRKNFNMKILNNFKKIQLPLDLKRKKSQFIIKNNFKKNSVKIRVKEIIKDLV